MSPMDEASRDLAADPARLGRTLVEEMRAPVPADDDDRLWAMGMLRCLRASGVKQPRLHFDNCVSVAQDDSARGTDEGVAHASRFSRRPAAIPGVPNCRTPRVL
jgi:hypothetical protein